MKTSLIDRIIYSITDKPKCCVSVKNPPRTATEKLARPQDARQVQYNRWSRRYKVYSGSYLPVNKDLLLSKGWKKEEIVKSNKQTNPSSFYRRKSTNQWVRNDIDHWHWYIWWSRCFDHKSLRKQKNLYYDKYGVPCRRRSSESHLKGER